MYVSTYMRTTLDGEMEVRNVKANYDDDSLIRIEVHCDNPSVYFSLTVNEAAKLCKAIAELDVVAKEIARG